ncbi:MAG: hypothetical protein LBR65_02390 [Culturomica sp.]|jgi:hypothetical protein|nr:hypothetical protein [Culturomica sp.]
MEKEEKIKKLRGLLKACEVLLKVHTTERIVKNDTEYEKCINDLLDKMLEIKKELKELE